MAKAGNTSNRDSGNANTALTTRPCPECGGKMGIVVQHPGHKSRWYCEKCGHMFPKVKGDWNPAQKVSQP